MSKETKSQVAFYIYEQLTKDTKKLEAKAYQHKVGGGHTFRLGNRHFVAFLPKTKITVEGE